MDAGVDPPAGAEPVGVDPPAGVEPLAGLDSPLGAELDAGVEPFAGLFPAIGEAPAAGDSPEDAPAPDVAGFTMERNWLGPSVPVGLASHSVPLGPAGPAAPGVKTSPEPPSIPPEPAAAALPSELGPADVVVSSAPCIAPPTAGTTATPISTAAARARWVGRGKGIRVGRAGARANDGGRVLRSAVAAAALSSGSAVEAEAAAGTAVSETIGSHWRRARAKAVAFDASSVSATGAGEAPRGVEVTTAGEPISSRVASVLVDLASRSPTRGTAITGTSKRSLAASTSDGADAAPPTRRTIRSGTPSSTERETAVARMSS